VYYGCANQAGEDNRNVGAHGGLLAGLPPSVPGQYHQPPVRLAWTRSASPRARSSAGEAHLIIAGGVESMTRAPFVMGKADSAFSRAAKIEDTTIGWRFVNPLMKAQYGIDSMPETAENVAREFNISRADQDAFALRSQQRWAAAHAAGVFKDEIVPVTMHEERRVARVRHRRASASGHHASKRWPS
jgi:acetyl-CoA acyltransferase